MAHRRNYLIWDFDGTLGYRPGQWSGALAQVLRRFEAVDVDLEVLGPFMRKGFPWHDPDQTYPSMRTPDAWWEAMRPVFEEAFAGCQIPPERARALAGKVRPVYTDLAEWRLFDDTIEVLSELREEGWRHAILSNHVPELRSLISGLGLSCLIDHVVNSAESGFEKPHPGAFQAALAALGDAAEVWMIGDNMSADVLGAESAGIPAILVRASDPRARRYADSLRGVRRFLPEVSDCAAE
jgi:putative hydrolase of the HAD superfamily